MPYQIRFTDPAKTITVEDQVVNNELSVSFVGKNYVNYAPVISENFLHLLENFSNNTQPVNPVQGQLWFDNSTGANYLKVYNGNAWKAVGFIQKSTTPPTNPSIGDLWVNPNTAAKQLKMYTGSSDPNKEWLLIGPENSTDSTGLAVVSLYDNSTSPKVHDVILLSARKENGDVEIIAVISYDTFTPKAIYDYLANFTEIKRGINLANNETKLWGVATSAESLVVGTDLVNSTKFLRSDQPNSVDHQLTIRNSNGLSIAQLSEFSITTTNSSTIISSLTNNNNIIFNVTKNDSPTSTLYIDANANVGIKNSTPTESLDVFGNVKINGSLFVNDNDAVILNLTKNLVTLNSNLIAKDITIDNIDYTPSLPQVTGGNQYNSAGNFIGYLEETSIFTGSWVGTSISSGINNQIGTVAEQFVMSVNTDSVVTINGWTSTEDGQSVVEFSPQYGKLTRVGINVPYVYFYSTGTVNSVDYGCKLYSVIINKAKDTATFTLLANNGCVDGEIRWKHITFFKITNNPTDAEYIKLTVSQVNNSWVG